MDFRRPLLLVDLLLRLGIAGLFIYAGVVKIWDFSAGTSATPQFFQDLLNYQLGAWDFKVVGLRLTAWDTFLILAHYLPWLEVAAGLALLSRRLRWGAALILIGLTAAFMAALSSAWVRDLDISCGCFGRGEAQSTDFPVLIARDGALLLALWFVAGMEWRRLRHAGQAERAAVPAV